MSDPGKCAALIPELSLSADLHTHSSFSDGKKPPEATVLRAIELGLETVGFADHSYTFFDRRYCMKEGALPAYRREIARLRQAYAGKIRVLCGIEQDYWSDAPTEGLDYIIGSVHYIRQGDVYKTIDSGGSPEVGIAFLRDAADTFFGGDLYAVMECYYETVGGVVEKTGADLIGHFDLITKFNDGGALFDETSPRYRNAAVNAADRLLAAGVPFEINTGAIARGFKRADYPSLRLMRYIKARGGSFVLSSDAHTPEHLAFGFEAWRDVALHL